jgi:hypothetical protein
MVAADGTGDQLGVAVGSGLPLGGRAAFAVGDDEEMQRSARPFYPFLCRNAPRWAATIKARERAW